MIEESIRSLPIWSNSASISIVPLEGGITNRNYLVTDGTARYAVRHGQDDPLLGISRENELRCARCAAERGLAPAIAHAEPGVMVAAFVDGAPLTPELARDPERVARVARQVRAIHESDPGVPLQYFSPFQVAVAYLRIAEDRGLPLPTADVDGLRNEISELHDALPPFRVAFCHNDLMPGNVLDGGEQMWIIDWEYGGFGNPFFDLAGFASNCEFDESRDEQLLAAYFGETSPEHGRQFRIMKAMAALRESLWGVVQASQSTIEFDYAGYRDDNYAKYRDALEKV